MRKRWVCLCMVGMMVLPGCGNTKKENVENDFAQVTEESATNTDAPTETSEIPAHLKYTVEADVGTNHVTVDADVISDGVKEAVVYSAVSKKVDEEYVRSIANSVFDNGDYTVEQPYAAMSENQMESLLSDIESQAEDYIWTYPVSQMENLLARPELVHTQELKSDTMFYEAEMDSLFAMYGPGVGSHMAMTISAQMQEDTELIPYKGARISGTVDGKPCELSVKDIEDGWNSHVWLYSRDDDIRYVRSYLNYETSELDTEQQNPCDYNSALKTAEAMIKKLMPDGDYRLTASYHRMVQISGLIDGTEADGYRFCYTPCIKEKILPMNAYTSFYIDDASGFNLQPMVCIDVNENGFLSARFSESVAPDEVLTQNANMLPFDQLDKIVQNYMEDILNKGLLDGTTEINRVEFSYILVGTEEGSAFVPCWLYYVNEKGRENNPAEAMFGVNALDGTVCTFGVISDNYVIMDTIY